MLLIVSDVNVLEIPNYMIELRPHGDESAADQAVNNFETYVYIVLLLLRCVGHPIMWLVSLRNVILQHHGPES